LKRVRPHRTARDTHSWLAHTWPNPDWTKEWCWSKRGLKRIRPKKARSFCPNSTFKAQPENLSFRMVKFLFLPIVIFFSMVKFLYQLLFFINGKIFFLLMHKTSSKWIIQLKSKWKKYNKLQNKDYYVIMNIKEQKAGHNSTWIEKYICILLFVFNIYIIYIYTIFRPKAKGRMCLTCLKWTRPRMNSAPACARFLVCVPLLHITRWVRIKRQLFIIPWTDRLFVKPFEYEWCGLIFFVFLLIGWLV